MAVYYQHYPIFNEWRLYEAVGDQVVTIGAVKEEALAQRLCDLLTNGVAHDEPVPCEATWFCEPVPVATVAGTPERKWNVDISVVVTTVGDMPQNEVFQVALNAGAGIGEVDSVLVHPARQ